MDEPSLSGTIVVDRSSFSCVMTPLIGVFLGRVRSSRLVVVSYMRESFWEMGSLSRPKVEYRGSRRFVVLWTKKFLLGDRDLVPSDDRVPE